MASRLSVNTIQTTTLLNRNNPTSLLNAATINSTGIFFKPNLPYFVATRQSQSDETGSGYMTFGTILANRGNWYNGSSAIAPVAGLYAFFCKTLTPNDTSVVDLRWYINGATTDSYGAGYSGGWSGHKQMTSFATFYLQQNDTVRVYNINSGTRCCGSHNEFMGYLVGG